MSAETHPSTPDFDPAAPAPEAGAERHEAQYTLVAGSYQEGDTNIFHPVCEDAITRRDELQLFGVADGMGGEGGVGAGAKAAGFVSRTVESTVAGYMATHSEGPRSPAEAAGVMRDAYLAARLGLDTADVDGGGAVATYGWVVSTSEGKPRLVIGHAGDTGLSIIREKGDTAGRVVDMTADQGHENMVYNSIIGAADLRDITSRGTDYSESAEVRRQHRLDNLVHELESRVTGGVIPKGLDAAKVEEFSRLVKSVHAEGVSSFDSSTYSVGSFDAAKQEKAIEWLETNYPKYPTLHDRFSVLELEPGDRVVVYSDGITGDWPWQKLTPEEKYNALRAGTPDEAARAFVEASKGPLGGQVKYGDRMIDRKGKEDDKSVVVFDVMPVTARTTAEHPAPAPTAAAAETRVLSPIEYRKLFPDAEGNTDPALYLHNIAERAEAHIARYPRRELMTSRYEAKGGGGRERAQRDQEYLSQYLLLDADGRPHSELGKLLAVASRVPETYGKVAVDEDGNPKMVPVLNADGSQKYRSPDRGRGEVVSQPVFMELIEPLEPGDPLPVTVRQTRTTPEAIEACKVISDLAAERAAMDAKDRPRQDTIFDVASSHMFRLSMRQWTALLGGESLESTAYMANIIARDPQLSYLVEQLAINVTKNRLQGNLRVETAGAAPAPTRTTRSLGALGVRGPRTTRR